MTSADPAKKTVSGWGRFVASAVVATVLVIASILIVGPRTVMGSVGAAVVMILFWPVLFCAFGLVFGAIASLLAAGDAGAEEMAEAGIVGGGWYYSRLISVRNPYFWGALLGAAVAVGALHVYVVKLIEPKELLAREHVKAIAHLLEEHHRKTGHFPQAKSEYLHEALDLPSTALWRGQPLEDPWGRPLIYRRACDAYSESFRVASTGWNGWSELSGSIGDDIVEKRTVFDKSAVTKEVLKTGTKKTIEYLKRKFKANHTDASPDRN